MGEVPSRHKFIISLVVVHCNGRAKSSNVCYKAWQWEHQAPVRWYSLFSVRTYAHIRHLLVRVPLRLTPTRGRTAMCVGANGQKAPTRGV